MARQRSSSVRVRLTVFGVAVAMAMAAHTSHAQAKDIDKIGRDLLAHQAEIRQIGQQIRAPEQLGRQRSDIGERRLIAAQVAFGIGNYDDSAILLYDLVERGPGSRSYGEALYYLAESLFQKRDYIGAQNYFIKLVDEIGTQSKFYQRSLERLVELSLKIKDSDVEQYLAKLNAVPVSQLESSVPYVRGRYLYFNGDFTAAIESFGEVPRDSDYSVRAQYFAGACYLALDQLGEAATAYQALLRTPPKVEEDKRVVELTHLALGRVFYERDQATEALDEYLAISRRSELFDDALYEIAWVYVNAQKFEQALRALELLALANPSSARLPDVRVLEGNLRIRRAQRFEVSGEGNPAEQYNKAMTVFEDTRDRYEEPLRELETIMNERPDPRMFVNQITGRNDTAFDVDVRLPNEAVAWLREDPQVERVVDLDQDLVTIERDLAEADAAVERLEAAINSGSSVNTFPSLAEKRARLAEIREALYQDQRTLMDEKSKLVRGYATAEQAVQLEQLSRERAAADRRLKALPGFGLRYSERVAMARERYDELARDSSELAVLVRRTEATLAALEKYLLDADRTGTRREDVEQYEDAISELNLELESLKSSLEQLRRDVTIARDQAGVGDAQTEQTLELQRELASILEREEALISSIRPQATGADSQRLAQLDSLGTQIAGASREVASVDEKISQVVNVALAEVRTAVVEEKQRIASYREEMELYEREAQGVGGEVLSSTFGRVTKKFYDVLIRADVGTTDVAWANKERTEESLKRLRLEESKDKRRLRDEFREILDERDRLEKESNAPKEGEN